MIFLIQLKTPYKHVQTQYVLAQISHEAAVTNCTVQCMHVECFAQLLHRKLFISCNHSSAQCNTFENTGRNLL